MDSGWYVLLKWTMLKSYKLPCFPEKPSPPINLDHSDQTMSSVKLTWEPPLKDGGSPILGYIIERREEGTDNWIRCNPRLVPDLTYKVERCFLWKQNTHFDFFKKNMVINSTICFCR